MKTKKYYIQFGMCENFMGKVEISKKEYEYHLKRLKKECEKSRDYELPVEQLEPVVLDGLATVENTEIFSCGCATTYLTKLECKEGFEFKKKSDRVKN